MTLCLCSCVQFKVFFVSWVMFVLYFGQIVCLLALEKSKLNLKIIYDRRLQSCTFTKTKNEKYTSSCTQVYRSVFIRIPLSNVALRCSPRWLLWGESLPQWGNVCDGSRRRSIYLHLCRRLRWRHLQPDGDGFVVAQGDCFWLVSFLWSTYYFFFSLFFSGPCSPNPCKNDGLCQVVTPTRRGDVFNEYICKCRPGFEGVHCQTSKFTLEELSK